MQGGSSLVDPDDRAVWADYRDRRQFKPRFPIATITDTTTVEHLERVVATLALSRSTPWQVSVVTIFQRGSGVWRTLTVGG